KVLARNGAICPRVFALVGQKLPPPQPAAIPREARSSIQSVNRPGHATSANAPVHVGGTYELPNCVRSRNTDICWRRTGLSGQYVGPAPQPATTPRWKSSSIHGANGLSAGTSAKTPNAGGGWYPGPSFAFSTNTAICLRSAGLAGQ